MSKTREEIKAQRADHYQRNKEKLKLKQREYAKTHPKKEYNGSYYEKNKDRLIRQSKERYYREKEKNPIHILFLRLRSRAKEKGIEFNIEESDIIIPSICPFLGTPLFFSLGKQTNNSPSVDRRDNSKGYIKGNICVMSLAANRMKNDLTISLAKRFVHYMETGEILNE